MKDRITLLVFAMRDHRTPWYAKAIVIMTLAYVISPIDLIPDFIPVVGLLDELILVPVAYSLVVRLIPEEVKVSMSNINTEELINSDLKVLGVMIIICVWSAFIYCSYMLIQLI